MLTKNWGMAVVLVVASAACKGPEPEVSQQPAPIVQEPATPNTCSGVFPSYWQDPAPKFAEMWKGQTMTNVPAAGWKGSVFQLSDDFPAKGDDERASQPWREERFNAMFARDLPQEEKTKLAREYIWLVMKYIQEGNTGAADLEQDWNICTNKVRRWYHMPFQTYDALSGREFVHGMTREAPVTFSLKNVKNSTGGDTLATTAWAVGFYNSMAAATLGQVWKKDGKAHPPSQSLNFGEGAVIGKLLFNTATAEQMPNLANMPAWTANISDPAFCGCKPAANEKTCTMVEDSQQCPRSTDKWGKVQLMQFDIAVKDMRAPGTNWVFGTFVADGQNKAAEKDPWMRISPLGLMWGNDPPPAGKLAHDHPAVTREKGFVEEVVFWEVVDMLNATGGTIAAKRPGHLGCNLRLNGPADNASSSCMSCHMTASIPDQNLASPPILAQFGGLTPECVTPDAKNPKKGTDAGGNSAAVVNGISFADIDSIYFANTNAATPVDMSVATKKGEVNVLGAGVPTYADGSTTWIATDFSLQMSQALTQWGQWQAHDELEHSQRKFGAKLPAR